jgi:hypothetical protein
MTRHQNRFEHVAAIAIAVTLAGGISYVVEGLVPFIQKAFEYVRELGDFLGAPDSGLPHYGDPWRRIPFLTLPFFALGILSMAVALFVATRIHKKRN